MPGTTTHYAIPYPEEKDEANQGATKITELAKKVDEELYEGNKVASGQVYTALTSRTNGTEYEPSATRAVQVCLSLKAATSSSLTLEVEVGGVVIADTTVNPVTSYAPHAQCSFICPAGKKWKAIASGTSLVIESSYLPL